MKISSKGFCLPRLPLLVTWTYSMHLAVHLASCCASCVVILHHSLPALLPRENVASGVLACWGPVLREWISRYPKRGCDLAQRTSRAQNAQRRLIFFMSKLKINTTLVIVFEKSPPETCVDSTASAVLPGRRVCILLRFLHQKKARIPSCTACSKRCDPGT